MKRTGKAQGGAVLPANVDINAPPASSTAGLATPLPLHSPIHTGPNSAWPAPTPYSLGFLALDLAPIVAALLFYAWMWRGGGLLARAFVLLLFAAQVAGASWVYRSLRREMQPKHWSLAHDGTTSPPTRTKETRHHHAAKKSDAGVIAPPSLSDASSSSSSDSGNTGQQRRRPRSSYFELVRAQTTNPFLHPTWKLRSSIERLRISAMVVTLVPFRAVSTGLILLCCCGALKVALLGLDLKGGALSKPLPTARTHLLGVIIQAASTAILALGFGYWKGLTIETSGGASGVKPEHDPAKAPIIIANHTSFLDPLLLYTEYFASAVGAIDNLKAPILGTIVSSIQTITVDRRDENSRRKVVEEIRSRASWGVLSPDQRVSKYGPGASGLSWPQVMLFPEGTCTNGRALIGFKQGAFVAKRPVQPVLIRYAPEKYPYGRFYPCWVSAGPSILVVLIRMWSEPLNYAQMEFLPVMAPLPEEMPATVDCNVFARRVRKRMAEGLGIPCTEHSYEDVVLQDAALNIGRKRHPNKHQHGSSAHPAPLPSVASAHVGDASLPHHLGPHGLAMVPPATPAAPLLTSSIEVSQLKAIFNVELETIERHLEKFKAMDVRRQGCVNYQEFLRFFDIDPVVDAAEGDASAMRTLFHLLDEDDNGSLDFREFLVGLALLADTDLLGTGPATPDKDRDEDSPPTEKEIEQDKQQQQLKMSEPTLRLAFSMFDGDMDGLVQLVDLKRMFRRAFPDVSEADVQAAFKDVAAAAAAQQQEPLASPGGTEKIGVTFEQFKDFCHSHPACVLKFKDTIFK